MTTASNNIGLCALCQRQAPLCRSHIIPEFCYEPTYDAKHRAIDMQRSGKGGRGPVAIQKGYRDRLLCSECECLLSRHEKCFKEFWYGPYGLPPQIDLRQRFVVLSGADPVSFRLFHLSVLWRASESPTCKNVDLGRYARIFRAALVSGSLQNTSHFPMFGQVLVDENGNVIHGLVLSPSRYRSPPSYAYSTVYAGCEWHVVVTDHPTKAQDILSRAVGCDGRLVLRWRHWLRSGTLEAKMAAYKRRENAC